MEEATERGEKEGRKGKAREIEMESRGGTEEGGAMRPWTLFPGTRDAKREGASEDETIPLLEGEEVKVLKEVPLCGWTGPWDPEETNPFLVNAKRPLSDPLAAGEKLWDNFIDKEFFLNTRNKPFPCYKVTEGCFCRDLYFKN